MPRRVGVGLLLDLCSCPRAYAQEKPLDGAHDGRHLRNALGRFPKGVTVLTTRTPNRKMEGLTANSFAALSLDPPLVHCSMNHNSPSVPGFKTSGHFAFKVLRVWNGLG